jgi:hypothetical protein
MVNSDSESGQFSSERRHSDRKKLIVDVRFEGGEATGIANTRDIGSGGFYMTTTAPLATGMQIVATMTLGGRELRLDGVVAYVDKGHGAGVRFKDLSEADSQFLSTEFDV